MRCIRHSPATSKRPSHSGKRMSRNDTTEWRGSDSRVIETLWSAHYSTTRRWQDRRALETGWCAYSTTLRRPKNLCATRTRWHAYASTSTKPSRSENRNRIKCIRHYTSTVAYKEPALTSSLRIDVGRTVAWRKDWRDASTMTKPSRCGNQIQHHALLSKKPLRSGNQMAWKRHYAMTSKAQSRSGNQKQAYGTMLRRRHYAMTSPRHSRSGAVWRTNNNTNWRRQDSQTAKTLWRVFDTKFRRWQDHRVAGTR